MPAIATTTAAATGLVGLELYKLYLHPDLPLKLRGNNFNLAVNQFASFEPLLCEKKWFAPFSPSSQSQEEQMQHAGLFSFDLWSCLDVAGGSLQGLMDQVRSRTRFEVCSVSTSSEENLFNDLFHTGPEAQARLDMSVAALYLQVVGHAPRGAYLELVVDGDFEEEVYELFEEELMPQDDFPMPTIRVPLSNAQV